jgi:uncharacterized protein YbjT (DUF2867 family)
MENKKQIILVAGATGKQGGAVAHRLLQGGNFAVHALTRDKNKPKAQALKDAGAELVEGDFNDPASLEKVLKDVYGVFSVQDFYGGTEVEIRQGKALADAAKKAGVRHFVYSSVGSAEHNTGVPHFDSKFKIEEHIKAIGLPATIMRPVFFMYNYEGMRSMIENGTLYMPLSPDKKLQQLSEDDYGKMVAKVFAQRDEFLGKEIEATSIDLSMTEVAATFSRVLGKEIKYQQIPFDAFQQQAGEEMTIMFRWFENTGYNADINELEKTFFPLSSLDTYLKEHGWGKAA